MRMGMLWFMVTVQNEASTSQHNYLPFYSSIPIFISALPKHNLYTSEQPMRGWPGENEEKIMVWLFLQEHLNGHNAPFHLDLPPKYPKLIFWSLFPISLFLNTVIASWKLTGHADQRAVKLFTLLPTLQFQFPSLLSSFAAGHLRRPLLPLCPHCRELSRSSNPAFPPHHIPLSNPQTPRLSLPGNPMAICGAVN